MVMTNLCSFSEDKYPIQVLASRSCGLSVTTKLEYTGTRTELFMVV